MLVVDSLILFVAVKRSWKWNVEDTSRIYSYILCSCIWPESE